MGIRALPVLWAAAALALPPLLACGGEEEPPPGARSELERSMAPPAPPEGAEGVDDTELFRAVQGELLRHPGLAHVAIAAEVRDGEVILRGVVPDLETLRLAEEVARGVPGVDAVESRIDVALEEEPSL